MARDLTATSPRGDPAFLSALSPQVDLEACVGVSDAVVISLVRNSEGCLERLRLSHAIALTAASTTAIAMFCPLLTHLYLLGCTGLQVSAGDSCLRPPCPRARLTLARSLPAEPDP